LIHRVTINAPVLHRKILLWQEYHLAGSLSLCYYKTCIDIFFTQEDVNVEEDVARLAEKKREVGIGDDEKSAPGA
jgi:hypothetical protein